MKVIDENQVGKTKKKAVQNNRKFIFNLGRRTDNRRLKLIKNFVFAFGVGAISTITACQQNTNNSRTNEQTSNQQKPESVNENKVVESSVTASPQIAETLETPERWISPARNGSPTITERFARLRTEKKKCPLLRELLARNRSEKSGLISMVGLGSINLLEQG